MLLDSLMVLTFLVLNESLDIDISQPGGGILYGEEYVMKKLSIIILSVICLVAGFTACTAGNTLPPPPSIDRTPYDVDTSSELILMLSESGQARLTNDITLDALPLDADSPAETTIDLNGNELTFATEDTMVIPEGKSLKIENGDIITTFSSPDLVQVVFRVGKDSKLEFDGVNYKAASSGILPSDNAEVVINDSVLEIAGAWGISTNAGNPEGYSVSIRITDSEISETTRTGTAVMLNTPTDLWIENSTITGGRQGVILRGGNGTFINSRIISRGEFDTGDQYYLDGTWATGNRVPMAALTVGNTSTDAYKYSTVCTIDDATELVMTDSGEYEDGRAFEIYVGSLATDSELTVTLSVPSDIEQYIKGNNSCWCGANITLNEEKLTK